MKPFLALLVLLAAGLLAGCVPLLAHTPATAPHPPSAPWRWQEDGWAWCPGQPDPAADPAAPRLKRLPVRPLRATAAPSVPDDLPPSWRRTLYDGERVISPIVVLNGNLVP